MNQIEFNNLVVDLDKKTCYIDGNEIYLTRMEFNLLLFFLEHKDKVFTRKEIINNVWTNDAALRAVDASVSKLRKKLNNVGKHITTRPGFGYGFYS